MPQNTRPLLLLAFVMALIVIRHLGASLEVFHFQPYLALFFGLTAFYPKRWLLVPLFGYLASSLWMAGSVQLWMFSVLLSFGLIVLWATRFSRNSGVANLLGGSLVGAGIFYLVTNSFSWLTSSFYAKTFEGFAQALWSGIPGYPPTWTFFRNDAVATLLFMGILMVLSKVPVGRRVPEARIATV